MRKYILGLGITVPIILLYILGFRVVYNPKLENSWEAISAIGTWIGVFATIAIALNIRNYSNTIKPAIRLISISTINPDPYIVITNTGEKPLIISQISFDYDKNSLGRINCEDETDIGAVTADYYIVKPFEMLKIDLPSALLQSQLSEFNNGEFKWPHFKNLNSNLKEKKIKIKMKSITGEYFERKTNITLQQYIDIVNYR